MPWDALSFVGCEMPTASLTKRIARYGHRRLFPVLSRIRPAPSSQPYSFDAARTYWGNVPRAQGGNPFDTHRLGGMSDAELMKEFEAEVEIARRKKERKVGFVLALDSIQSMAAPEVMDYGSGIGFYGFEMLARHPGARVTFVDINWDNLATITRIARMKGNADRVHCVLVKGEQAQDLQFVQPFDLIMSMGVLHHTPHAPQIVDKLTCFLRDGGIFQVMLYNKEYLRRMERAAGRRLNHSGFGAVTDPKVGGMSNPYSEPYDDAKARKLFHAYELVSADYPDPCYNTYRFRKVAA